MNFRSLAPSVPICIVLTALAASGCDQSKDGSEAFQEFEKLRAETICEMNFRCCSGRQVVASGKEQCLDFSSSPYEIVVENEELSIDYDQANKCFSEVQGLSCEGWEAALRGDPPASCDNVLSGKANGQPCDSPMECDSQFCRQVSPDASSTYDKKAEGQCSPLGKEGDPCVLQVYSCELGLSCRGTADAATCVPFGGDCSGDNECQSRVCTDGTCEASCYGFPGSVTFLGASW